MALLGTVVNALAVVLGSLLGFVLPRLREEMRVQVMQGVGLVVAVMGISMAMRSENIIVVLVSLVLGGAAGGCAGTPFVCPKRSLRVAVG